MLFAPQRLCAHWKLERWAVEVELDVAGLAGVLYFDRCVVEERKELIVLALAKRIVLMIMALGTFDGRAEPHGARRVDAVNDLVCAIRFGVNTGFYVTGRGAGKPVAIR